jgi:RNA polymerase sigma-70 factor, ECF subfamily
MSDEPLQSPPITELLRDWRDGDAEALNSLTQYIYADLRRRAAAYLRGERPGHTLQTTGLAHETFIKLIGKKDIDWADRNHFFAIASQSMRRILVDHARTKHREKRGGEQETLPLDEARNVKTDPTSVDLVALDEALVDLAEFDPRQAKIVELKYFGGMTLDETSEILEISRETVKRDWQIARAWLRKRLE